MASIVDIFQEHRRDDTPAIITDGHSITYRELTDLVRQLAGGLERKLPEIEDLCLVVAHPGLPESLSLTLAGWSLGLRVATIPAYLKAREREAVLSICTPTVIVSENTTDSPHSLSFEELRGSAPSSGGSSRPHARLESFTGGTTGRPKCAERDVDRLSDDVGQLISAAGIVARDRVTTMTASLSTTSVLPAIQAGATVVTMPLRSPRQFWKSIGEHSISVISGTPYAYELAALKKPDRDQIQTVRLALTASARLRPTTIEKIKHSTDIDIRNIMCSSESGHITFNTSSETGLLAHSVGKPLPGVQVEIRADDGAVVPPGKTGVVCVKSRFTATGYRNDPDETAQVFQDGWVVSNDSGYRDSQGNLYLTGRNDPRIHFGTAKLDPREIEDVVLQHPAVHDALIVGIAHERLGQIPVLRAVISSPVTTEELLNHCRVRLSPSKVPQRVEFVSEIAKSFTGQPVRPRFHRFTDVE